MTLGDIMVFKMKTFNKKFEYINKAIVYAGEFGLSSSDTLLIHIQGLAIASKYEVSRPYIKDSWWHKKLRDYFLVQESQQTNNYLFHLHARIQDVAQISFIRHPIKKYKSYKQIINAYYGKRE